MASGTATRALSGSRKTARGGGRAGAWDDDAGFIVIKIGVARERIFCPQRQNSAAISA